jgi:hypothetical protein
MERIKRKTTVTEGIYKKDSNVSELSGFVFTKRQPLKDQKSIQNINNGKCDKTTGKIVKDLGKSIEEFSEQEQQHQIIEELLNPHESISTPTKLNRRSSIGLRGKRNFNGVYRKIKLEI